MSVTNTATYINSPEGFRGDARLYKLDPPLAEQGWGDESDIIDVYEYVIVSASFVPYSGPETYIFGSNEKGEILNWGELAGSFQGGMDHAEALGNAGYIIADAELEAGATFPELEAGVSE